VQSCPAKNALEDSRHHHQIVLQSRSSASISMLLSAAQAQGLNGFSSIRRKTPSDSRIVASTLIAVGLRLAQVQQSGMRQQARHLGGS
jgi:hypothetical protein